MNNAVQASRIPPAPPLVLGAVVLREAVVQLFDEGDGAEEDLPDVRLLVVHVHLLQRSREVLVAALHDASSKGVKQHRTKGTPHPKGWVID